MSESRLIELCSAYRMGLLENTLPFWLPRCLDREHGGYLTCRDRDGTLLDTDKGMWQQGRFAWLLSHFYNHIEAREDWLEAARSGIDFIRKHGFEDRGRMYFMVTREGRPLRKRRYVFTEAFAAMALAEYAKASGEEQAAVEAWRLFEVVTEFLTVPGKIPPKVDARNRPCKSLSGPMILLATAQVLRSALNSSSAERWIDRCIEEIRRDFMRPDMQAVMETVGPDGKFLDHFDGRMLNPGHAMEAAWFVLAEARHRQNAADLIQTGTTMLDWMWDRGWDSEYGGILYYTDVRGLPVQEYWHDMKFWWPQNEAMIATLLAYQLTRSAKYLQWHLKLFDWVEQFFPDREYGEWFGYLHRDGRRSNTLKGNIWKGPYHLPRMQWMCWKICEDLLAEDGAGRADHAGQKRPTT